MNTSTPATPATPTPQASKPARSSRADVRNPMTGIPEVLALRDLDPEANAKVIAAFRAISKAAHAQGNALREKRKRPMAAYWCAKGVDFRHLALAIRKGGAA